ncbi:MAG: O-antigen ligase family protein [Patescibacteria group bacterium]|nr:O-antigen ligase family protein [Patescibacteria group bacterium]
MDFAEEKVGKIFKFLLLFYIVLIPFGQLARFDIKVLNFTIPFIFYDLVAVALFVTHFFCRTKLKVNKQMFYFFLVALFSFLVNIRFVFDQHTINSTLYLLRLASWGAIYSAASYVIGKNLIKSDNLTKYLYYSIFVACLFGFFQYIFVPDLRFLIKFGWDDHLNRLAGFYFDPTYIGFLSIFGFFLLFFIYRENLNPKNIFLFCSFFLIVLLLTYSRASYLAFIASSVYFFASLYNKRLINFFTIFTLASIFVFFLFSFSRFEGEGVRLGRVASIYQRLENYSQTLTIIKDYPLFGVGFNNMCRVRLEYFGGNADSNACSGADSSILFVWATMGIIGLILFANLIYVLFWSKNSSLFVKTIFIVIFVHSIFSNSFFYSLFVGIFMIIFAITADLRHKINNKLFF